MAQLLDKYIAERILPWNWTGTAGQLYDLLNNPHITDSSSWPRSPKGLTDQLRRIAPAYRAKGIEITHLRHTRGKALCGAFAPHQLIAQMTLRRPASPFHKWAALAMENTVNNDPPLASRMGQTLWY